MVQGVAGCWPQVHKHDCAIEKCDASEVRSTGGESLKAAICWAHSDDCDKDEGIGDEDDEDSAELNEATNTEEQDLTDVGVWAREGQ